VTQRMMRSRGWMMALGLLAGAALPVTPAPAWAQADQRPPAFNAPLDCLWPLTRSTLKSLGWEGNIPTTAQNKVLDDISAAL
jgi:hypothetical protein